MGMLMIMLHSLLVFLLNLAILLFCGITGLFIVFCGYIFLKSLYIKETYWVRVRTDAGSSYEVASRMNRICRGKAILKEQQKAGEKCELLYLVPGRFVKWKVNGQSFSEELYDIDSVTFVGIEHNDTERVREKVDSTVREYGFDAMVPATSRKGY